MLDPALAHALHVHRVARGGGAEPPHAAFQTSTITALLDGRFEGDVSIGELRRHGDLGLGTFNSLDGELVALDGEFWRADEAGALHRAGDDLLTPFAAVTRFAADETVPIGSPLALPGLIELLQDHLPASGCVAVRLDGRFSQVHARSVGRQRPPYRPLAEVAERQHEFDLTGIEGSLVGFVFPSVAGALNVPGHHLHVATADRAAGGHVLDVDVERATLMVDRLEDVHLELPPGVDLPEEQVDSEILRRVEGPR